MTQTIEQLKAHIERLNYSLAQETELSDRLKMASRMPGTGNYVKWVETIRNSHDQVEQLTARVRELEEDRNQWMANSRENKLIAEQCNRDLAASQLHAAQLRKHIALALEFCNIPAFDVSETLATALSLPGDTSALDSYVAEKVKEAMKMSFDFEMDSLARQRDLAVEALTKTLAALRMPCDRWSKIQSEIVSKAVKVAELTLSTIKESEK